MRIGLFRRTMVSLCSLCTIILFLPGGMAFAEERPEEEEALRLEEIVVVAPAIIEGNEVNQYGSVVTVVSEEQISDLNAQDLPSALRRTPGVVISRYNPIGSFGGAEGGAIFIRGQGSSRPGAEIQMLVDGVPKFVGVWTHPLMDVLSVDIVDQAEVYKGAQPVLFGNMAFGAVNLTTKRRLVEGFTTSIHGAYGSYDTLVEVLEHGGKVERFDYYLIQSYRSSDGHRDNADGELQNYFGRAGYEISENWDFSLVFNRTDNWADDPGPADLSAPSEGRYSTEDYLTIATLSNRYERAEGYLKVYWDNADLDWVDQQGTPGYDTLTDYDNYGVRAREILRLWDGGEILIGVDTDYFGGEVDFLHPVNPDQHFERETFRLVAPHAAISHQLGSKEGIYAIPSAGFRYLSHSEFENETAPQAGLIVGYKDTEFHASYARGVNYPGVFVKVQEEIFLPGDNKWEDLNPELLDHFEVGVSHSIRDKIRMDLTYFNDDGKDRIVVSPPPPFPPLLTNIEEYTIEGVEGTVTLSPLPELAFFAGFTYLDSDPKDLPYTPEWTASSGVNYRLHEKLRISLDAQYVDEQYVTSRARLEGTVNVDKVDSYFLLNGKLTYDFTLPYGNMKGQAYLAGENLTDTDYEQKRGYPMPGTSGMVGVVLRF